MSVPYVRAKDTPANNAAESYLHDWLYDEEDMIVMDDDLNDGY